VALFNESLEGRYNQLIQRLHNHKGSPPAPQISPEIDHSIVLENDRPEHLYLAQTELWIANKDVVANATHVSTCGIRNPAGSGILVVITGCVIENPQGLGITVDLKSFTGPSTASTFGSTFFRDSRRGFGGGCPVQLTADQTSFLTEIAFGGSGPIEQIRMAAGEGERVSLAPPLILKPGTEVSWVTQAVNQELMVDWIGYFRPLAAMDLLG